MSAAENNLHQRLAAIVATTYENPFDKVASRDEQLDVIADTLTQPSASKPLPVNKPVTLGAVIKTAAFQRGFARVSNTYAEDIEKLAEALGGDALKKSASADAPKPITRRRGDNMINYSAHGGAMAGGAALGVAGAASGYNNSRKAGRGRLASAGIGLAKGLGGAVIGGAAGYGIGGGGMAARVLRRSEPAKS